MRGHSLPILPNMGLLVEVSRQSSFARVELLVTTELSGSKELQCQQQVRHA